MKCIRIIIWFSLLSLPWNGSLQAQLPRNNYGARLEFDDRIIHGAGQSPEAFREYWELMPEKYRPMIYMYYVGLNNLGDPGWSEGLIYQLDRYPDHMLMPQVGLSMTSDGAPETHYEDDVAAGLYDEQIGYLADGLKRVGRPVFLRIGYEFNGTTWNGYMPSSYISAFRRITDALRAEDVEVATVWCYAVDGATNYMDYYPGDDRVDWWAIDPFSNYHFSNTTARSFMSDAHEAGKPVMIGETTPRNIGADQDGDWNNWFSYYYDFIDNQPGIKATCYINWNWTGYPQWSDWGDARLGTNDYVTVNYIHRQRNELFLNSGPEREIRTLMGYDDQAAPPAVSGIISTPATDFPVELRWPASYDPSGIAHYTLYRDGQFLASFNDTGYIIKSATAGEEFEITVSATDRAGNESPLSDPVEFHPGDTLSKALNPDMTVSLEHWRVDRFNGGQAVMTHRDSMAIIEITTSTGTNWHIQLVQGVEVRKGQHYMIEMEARSEAETAVELILQQNHSPYQLPIMHGLVLTPDMQLYRSPMVTAAGDDQMNVGFFTGQAATGSMIYVNTLRLLEIKGTGSPETPNERPVADAGADVYHTDPASAPVLDGSSSYDPDGAIAGYSWKQLSGEEVLQVDQPSAGSTSLSSPVTGNFLFRLTVTDNGGAIASDEVEVNIEFENTATEMLHTITPGIYPNPAGSWMRLKPAEDAGEKITVRLLDATGRTVQEWPELTSPGRAGEIHLELAALLPGIYFIEIRGKITCRKTLVIQQSRS